MVNGSVSIWFSDYCFCYYDYTLVYLRQSGIRDGPCFHKAYFLTNIFTNTYSTDVLSGVCCVLQKSRSRVMASLLGGQEDDGSGHVDAGLGWGSVCQQVGW